MPELRKDPIIGRWVIISTERGKMPMDFKREKCFLVRPRLLAAELVTIQMTSTEFNKDL